MAELQALTRQIALAEATQDFDAMRAARLAVVAHSPSSAAAAEALYKVGLDALFRARNLPDSIALFEQAAKSEHSFWSLSARTSLALCYLQQKRGQKALFELRKVAYGKEAGAHAVVALTFMEAIYAQDHKGDDAAKVRKDRQLQLLRLLGPAASGAHEPAVKALTPQERGHYLHQLALTFDAPSDRARARAALNEAQALGPDALGAELWQAVQQASKAFN